jgi:2'-5' RNA ligase
MTIHAPAREATHPATARLFLALWPTPAVRRALAAHQARWRWPERTAHVSAASLHLTLHFIGAVPSSDVAHIADGLRVKAAPFALDFGRAELWPRGLAVYSPLEVPAALAQLHAALADALHRLQLKVETRAFRPHVTLARKAAGATPPDNATPLHWPVRGYALVLSAGGSYTPLARYG